MEKIRPYVVILIFSNLLFNVSACSKPTESITIIADFNSKNLRNNLNGDSGTWEIDPDDTEQYINADLDYSVKRGAQGASLRLEYDVDSPENAVNGFWTQLLSFDASKYDHFKFWVKGDKEKGYPKTFKIEFKKFQRDREGRDEVVKGSFVVKGVTDKWQKITVPLNVMNGILDWHGIKEFVITFQKRRLDNKKGVLYLDDLAFVHTGEPGPKISDIVLHKRKKTDKELGTKEFAEFLIARLNGFPKKVFIKKEFPKEDREFLMELAGDLWRYFDEVIDKEYQLPLDYISFGEAATISDKTQIGDYTNITNIGLYLMCLVSGYDFGFITKEEAIKRLEATLNSIEKLEKYNNFPYNYYDLTIFQRTSNFISFVDSGWLAAGIVVAKNAFPDELGDKCQKLLETMDFSFFYDPVEGQMYHGFYTNINYYSEHYYGAFYTEPRAISYLAIGKGDVPIEHWFMLARTFPEDWLWQTQIPKGRRIKHYLGYPTEGGYYIYNDIKFVPSWGGSMFEALMPTLVIKERELAPRGLGVNDERYAKIQIEYAFKELGYPLFGLSPCSVPSGGYSEYGVKLLGMKGYKAGVITPHATFLALEFAPEECIKNLREMLRLYNAYGEYGFYDAIDITGGRVATKYLCLDQAMSFIALNNYLNNGKIRERFHSDPIAKSTEGLLKVEDFFN